MERKYSEHAEGQFIAAEDLPLVIEELLTAIRNPFRDLYPVISAFSEEQFHRIPFAGSWSPAQVTEHIIKFSSGIPDNHTGITRRPYDEQVETISELFLNFSIRMEAPGFIQPGNPSRSRGEALGILKNAQAVLEDRIKTTDLTLTCLDIEIPVFGCLTRYEWIRFIGVHIQRHTWQLKNILHSLNA